MTAPRFTFASLQLLAAGAVVLVTGAAHAAPCSTDADCGKGFSCQTVASGACVAPACDPSAGPCDTTPTCDITEIKECQPASCTADTDCAEGMVCLDMGGTDCAVSSPPTCAAGQDCGTIPEPLPCTPTVDMKCAPKYVAPCAVDADCGDGFTCVADSYTTCTASAGSGTPASGGGTAGSSGSDPAPTPGPAPADSAGSMDGGGAIPPDMIDGCTTVTSDTKHCEPKKVTCAATTDCPSAWACVELGGGQSCSGGGKVLPDGGVVMEQTTCTTMPSEKLCLPPYFDLYAGALEQKSSYSGGLLGVPSGSGNDTGGANGGTGAPPTAPGGGAESADAGAGAAAPATSSDDGGCQMGTGRTSGTGAALLAMLGLAGIARRRRPRAA